MFFTNSVLSIHIYTKIYKEIFSTFVVFLYTIKVVHDDNMALRLEYEENPIKIRVS